MKDKNLSSAVGLTAENQTKVLNEVLELLLSTHRKGAEAVAEWIKTSRFATVSGSGHKHSSYRGGLLVHSLNVALAALKLREEALSSAAPAKRGQVEKDLPKSSVILAALLHDVSKEPVYYYNGEKWEKDHEEAKLGHGKRSVEMLEALGLQMTTAEKIAIRWHDYDLYKEKDEWAEWSPKHPREAKTPLLAVVHKADRRVRPLEDGAQKQGLLVPLHHLAEPALKDTELRVRKHLETYPRSEVHSYEAGKAFAYNHHKEVDRSKEVQLGKDVFSVFDNRYPCALRYDGKVFPSALVLYLYLVHTQSPDLQEQLGRCRNTQQAEELCPDKSRRDPDWKERQFDTWLTVNKLKAESCVPYRRKLKATGSASIVQLSNYPRFLTLDLGAVPGKALGGDSWQGVDLTQPCYVGCNLMGRVHEEVRNEINAK